MIHIAPDNDDLGDEGDGLPTMGEESETELKRWVCVCGQPSEPGILHRQDGPCYVVHNVMARPER